MNVGCWKYDFHNFFVLQNYLILHVFFLHLIFRKLHLFEILHSAKYSNPFISVLSALHFCTWIFLHCLLSTAVRLAELVEV